jgi:hypothetical protein
MTHPLDLPAYTPTEFLWRMLLACGGLDDMARARSRLDLVPEVEHLVVRVFRWMQLHGEHPGEDASSAAFELIEAVAELDSVLKAN